MSGWYTGLGDSIVRMGRSGLGSVAKCVPKSVISYGLKAGASVGSVATMGSLGLTYAGFTTSGIAAGSTAAVMQSSIGNVVVGSTFATLQSLGAIGAITTTACVAAPVTLVCGVGYYYCQQKNDSK